MQWKTFVFALVFVTCQAKTLLWSSVTSNVDSQCQVAVLLGVDLVFVTPNSYRPLVNFTVLSLERIQFELVFNETQNDILLSYSLACYPKLSPNTLTSIAFVMHML